MRPFFIKVSIILDIFLVVLSACKKDKPAITIIPTPPVLTTVNIFDLTDISVSSGGNISSDGGDSLTIRGVCWNISPNPTIENNKTNNGIGAGKFTSNITGLAPETKYYLRAYAKNVAGIRYGNEINFKTWAVVDVDTNGYNSVTIGTQKWIAENLKTTKFNDGTAIPLVTDSLGWRNLTTSAYCWYDNKIDYKNIYGALYNWYTVNTGKLCPTGWHVPTDTEWTTLTNFLGGDSVAAGKIREISGTLWATFILEGNQTGFTALPGGQRNNGGNFEFIKTTAYWWSKTSYINNTAWFRYIYTSHPDVARTFTQRGYGLSVRCVKN